MLQNSTTPRVSIVIPCYNHGRFIRETLRSIEQVKDKHLYEIIIVNDGSTDEFTNKELQKLSEEGYHVINQKNAGQAAARNTAILKSRGEYILPVDSDNMIYPEYIYRGIEILDANKDISVLYGNAKTFGNTTGLLTPGAYNLQKLMLVNYIDACAMYRRSLWDAVGGYDPKIPTIGYEDWELWLNASFMGFKFLYVDEVLFEYRILDNSTIHKLKADKRKGDANIAYMVNKHKAYYGPQYIDKDIMKKFEQSPMGFVMKLFLKKYFPKKFDEMVSQGKLRRYI
ncbi:MAG: glycosyltransferase family 2 protein [Taibaiella sp.]|nr:glycosyltransferase family 2 protein [Taibaiella sp.]